MEEWKGGRYWFGEVGPDLRAGRPAQGKHSILGGRLGDLPRLQPPSCIAENNAHVGRDPKFLAQVTKP